MQYFDRIIIGAGLYGLYAAQYCGKKHQSVLVLECDPTPFRRATYINQARAHQGYHYPRSLSTAMRSAHYFERFNKDYSFCINSEFEQIYATSTNYSWTNGEQFKKFCEAANIPCEPLNPDKYFKKGMCDGAFLTREYSYDALILRDYYMDTLSNMKNVEVRFAIRITDIHLEGDEYEVVLQDGKKYRTKFLLNAAFAGVNQILDMMKLEKFRIKYELCEIILIDVSDALKPYGFTVMDGPFFSIMPFGLCGSHSLTSVTFTPHATSYDATPRFDCQERSNGYCSSDFLGNCNDCIAKPQTAYAYMSNLARKYLKEEYDFSYKGSLYSMKPILMKSEIDDSRPTVVRTYSTNPTCVSVLSGKINTVYDLDEVLDNDN